MIIIRKAVRGVSRWALVRFVHRARVAAGLPGTVNVVLVSSNTVRKLNRSFRGKDKATDVLAFPAVPWLGARGGHASHLSGEVVISSELAAANARRYGHEAIQEVKVLILHGMLHLAGYDHEHDQGTMARKEERLRQELGLREGVIGRTKRAERRGTWKRRLRKLKAAVHRKRRRKG